mmetsp:Transcript_7755/g.16746  ORF Transcript_7755/g.16746 Transcript_7755/m.16746 type:complete len:239 (+) Transcript_7755:204-920(+)
MLVSIVTIFINILNPSRMVHRLILKRRQNLRSQWIQPMNPQSEHHLLWQFLHHVTLHDISQVNRQCLSITPYHGQNITSSGTRHDIQICLQVICKIAFRWLIHITHGEFCSDDGRFTPDNSFHYPWTLDYDRNHFPYGISLFGIRQEEIAHGSLSGCHVCQRRKNSKGRRVAIPVSPSKIWNKLLRNLMIRYENTPRQPIVNDECGNVPQIPTQNTRVPPNIHGRIVCEKDIATATRK